MAESTRIIARRWDDFVNYPAEYAAMVKPFVADGDAITATLAASDGQALAAAVAATDYDLLAGSGTGYQCRSISFDYEFTAAPGATASFIASVGEISTQKQEIFLLDPGSPTAGDFEIGISGDMETIDWDFTAADLLAALVSVFGAGLVVVIPGGDGTYQIAMNTRLGASGLTANFAGLTATSPDLSRTQEYDADTEETTNIVSFEAVATESTSGVESWSYDSAYGSGEFVVIFMVSRTGTPAVFLEITNRELSPTIGVTGTAPEGYEGKFTRVPAGSMEISLSMGYGPTYADIPAGVCAVSGHAPPGWWCIVAADLPEAKTIYTLTLSKSGLADAEIPISSFSARRRSENPSYLSVVIPASADWIDTITDRIGGEMALRKGYSLPGGRRQLEEIIRVDLETMAIDRGARSDSATVVGHGTSSNTSPKTWTVSGVSYYALRHDGRRAIRCEVDLFLRPGDTCVYGDEPSDSMVVGAIQYTVAAKPASAVMEVSEA